MVTLTSMRGPIPADAGVLGQPALGRGAGSWAAGLWMEPDLGSEDHAAERCRVREMRSTVSPGHLMLAALPAARG